MLIIKTKFQDKFFWYICLRTLLNTFKFTLMVLVLSIKYIKLLQILSLVKLSCFGEFMGRRIKKKKKF